MRQTATTSVIRAVNRSAILDQIRQQRKISYIQISRLLRISLPTVMRIVEGLIQQGFVRPVGFSQESALGRPSGMVEFNGSAHYVIGLDLGESPLRGGLVDLSGNFLAEQTVPTSHGRAQKNIEKVEQLIHDLMALARGKGLNVLGIGIGAPGVTRPHEGQVTFAPSLGWQDTPVKELLQSRFPLPVFVENDANLAALAELNFGVGRGVQDLVCLSIRTGLGAGIIIGGILYRGYNDAAGEAGYIPPAPAFLGKTEGGFGALEAYISCGGIQKRAVQAANVAQIGIAPDSLTTAAVFEAAQRGEPWAQPIITETLDHLGFAVAAVASLLNPQVICLSGSICPQLEPFIELIQQRVQNGIPYLPRLVCSQLGNHSVILGAINLVLAQILDFSMVKFTVG